MEALFISTGVVALAEIGDKTQLLAFILAARFKKPVPIIAGILCATVINHGLAGALGAWITSTVSPDILRWILGVSFLGMAIWTLIPDKIEEEETQIAHKLGVFGATFITFFLAEMGDKTQIATIAMAAWMLIPDQIDDEDAGGRQLFGVFGTTVLAFFLAEMGDKTQIATVALAARYGDLVAVVAGTTLGMMLANVPAVFLGDRIAKAVSMTLVHSIAATIFAVLGVLTLLNVGQIF